MPRSTTKTAFAFTTLALAALAPTTSVLAKPCLSFDGSFNLYVFGGNTDYSLGTQDAWLSGNVNAKALTTQGRPPFNGPNTQCFFAQFFNAMYVIDGDTSKPNVIHIFDYGSQSWSAQTVNLNGVDHEKILAILDRDTNVFFGLQGNTLYQLDMAQLTAAGSDPRQWEGVGNPPFMDTIKYDQPVMALAQNHIHFLNIGQPGEADIFVIHFAYFQPEIQSYPGVNGGSGFPSTHGSTASIFRDFANVQQKFAFWPDDGSATYIIDVASNTTASMAGLTDKSASVYAAGQTSLVQLTTSGNLYAIPFNPDDNGANAQATWTKLAIPDLGLNGSNSPNSNSGNGPTSTGGSKTGTSTTTNRSTGSPAPTKSTDGSAAARMILSWGMAVAGLALGAIGLAL